MVQRIDYQDVLDAQAGGVPVLEVLPAAEYRRLHIADALSLPLKQLDRELAGRLEVCILTCIPTLYTTQAPVSRCPLV